MSRKTSLHLLVTCLSLVRCLVSGLFDSDYEAGTVETFRIVEESVNGTEVMGVSEYLRNQVNVRYHDANPSSIGGRQSSYQLLDSHELLTRLLQIEPQTGRLFIAGRIDRELLCPQSASQSRGGMLSEACFKRLNVLATVSLDKDKSIEMVTIPLKLNIEDINDNAPTWNTVNKRPLLATDPMNPNDLTVIDSTILETPGSSEYSRLGPDSSTIRVSAAYDPDSGANGEITYYLENFKDVSGDEIKNFPVPFTISGPENGTLLLTPRQPIDYERKSLYNLLLIAKDSGKPSQTSHAHLRIHVVDVNDESPKFTQEIFGPLEGAISERTPPGTILLNVTATDADASEANSHLRYSMVPSNNLLISKFFSVHQDGRILLRHWLDYESLEPAHMSSSPSAARAAPRSKEKQFAFFVQATDSAPFPYNRTGTALVVIPIKDENDEAPIISSRFLGPPELVRHGEAGVIVENSTVPIRLAYIQARDPDFNGRDRVECSVMDNAGLSLRRISPTEDSNLLQNQQDNQVINNDFLLSLETPVDRETTQMLVARIHCVDEAKNPSDKLIRIRVLDINDEAPVFLWPTFFFSVKENRMIGPLRLGSNETGQSVPPGYRIGRVIAYDRDQNDNAEIVYSILPDIEVIEPLHRPSFFSPGNHHSNFLSAKASDLFRIDTFTGEMFALHPFDAERIELIKLQVMAVDQPKDPKAISHTGTASVHIRIIDVNDHSPIFFKISENDTNPQAFQRISLDTITPVDSYIFSIHENRRAYTFVGRIGAIDPDVSFWFTTNSSTKTTPTSSRIMIQFALDTSAAVKDALSIHTSTGQLRTLRPLDREAVANYTFNVLAIDKGPEDGLSRTSTVRVIVLVEDENDNDPVFVRPVPPEPSADASSPSVDAGRKGDSSDSSSTATKVIHGPPDKVQVVVVHKVSLSMIDGSNDGSDPNNPNGRPLIRVEAHDPDDGLNGEIRYSIASGDTANLFYLDPVSGSLFLKSLTSLPDISTVRENTGNAESEQSYVLQLDACDMGKPKRCAAQVWLEMVMDYPSSMLGGKGFRNDPNRPENNRFPNLLPYPEADRAQPGYLIGEGGQWPAFKDRWSQHNSQVERTGFAKDRQKMNGMRGSERDGRYLGEFAGHERGQYGIRRSGVTASEAVIICLAVIFAVLLFAALVLVYLVKRKSIYFSIGGRHKARPVEDAPSPDYNGGNFKHEASTTCELMDTSEKASLYRVMADPHNPGKIVFVDNNFDRQSLPGAAGNNMPDSVALSPMSGGKRVPVAPEYGLRRGMSASAAVLSNLESVYITPESESPMNASDYPGFISRSTMAFNYPTAQAKHSQNFHDADNNHPMVFGTIVGPNGTTHSINLGAEFGSPPQRSVGGNGGEYITTDTATFQRRCASLKPRPVANAIPYRYIQPPGSYVYGSLVNSPTRVMHCRGISEPAAVNNQVSFSPHRQYVLAEDPHTYHDIDFAAATIQRQRRMAPMLEQVAEVTPSDGQQISSPYGRLRQPSAPYIYAPNANTSNNNNSNNSRYATLSARMALDGEVTALMEPMTLKRQRHHVSHPDASDQKFLRQQCESEEMVNSEDFDSQSDEPQPDQSLNSLIDVEDAESISDLNAKLLTSIDEDIPNGEKLTNRKTKMDQPDQTEPTTSQAAEMVVGSEATTSSQKSSSQAHPTYAIRDYREASFV